MKKSKVQKIIVKFLNKEASHDELETLDVWMKNTKNISIFNQFVKTEYLTSLYMVQYDLDKGKESISQKVRIEERKQRRKTYWRISAAASILLLIGSFFFKLDSKQETRKPIVNTIETGSNKAVLTLDNGDQIALEKGISFQTGAANSNGEKLVYAPHKEEASKRVKTSYNYITIPRGGQFFVQLSDGTKVWLNSDTKLKYPTKFNKDQTREVELVYGEAYFEVSPSTKHNGMSFNVLTREQKVNVLGTEFNIQAYREENEIATTLVGGKVVVQKGSSKKVLNPNQQSRITDNVNTINVLDVDASLEISWVNGLFVFNEESLGEIMKKLSRWYDVDVVFESAERKNFVFTAILERTKSFDDILNLIEATGEGEVKFEVRNRTIHIK